MTKNDSHFCEALPKRSKGSQVTVTLSSLFIPRQLFQLNEQLPPLDLGDPKLLTDLVWFFTGMVIVQCACPAAHIEREVLGQTGFLADIFEDVFQPTR